jgi:hypothetical protein
MKQIILFAFLLFIGIEVFSQNSNKKCPLIIGGQVTINKDSINSINLCNCFDTAQRLTYDITASKQGTCQTASEFNCYLWVKPFNHGDLMLLQNIIAWYSNGKKRKFPSTRIFIK